MPPVRADENPRDLVSTFEEVLAAVSLDYYTAMPSLIQSYDEASRRARVQPALRRVEVDGRSFERPAVGNVPVVWPGGGDTTAHATLEKDDPVYAVYAMRGINGFLDTHELTDQDQDGALSPKDMVVLPWFGKKRNITPPGGTAGFPTGFTIQSDDGDLAVRVNTQDNTVELLNRGRLVRVSRNKILLQYDTNSLEVNGNGVLITGDLRVTGTTYTGTGGTEIDLNTHTHAVTGNATGPPLP